MPNLIGEHINLRALEPEDLDFLCETENNEDFWEISSTQTPFSKYILKQYISNAHQDIYEAKQFRFVICNTVDVPVGMIDLFDFNPQHHRVGIGILILPQFQQLKYASEALELLIDYTFLYLNVHQLFANISEDNHKSIAHFEKFDFKKAGLKKDWIFTNNTYKSELLYQLIRPSDES